MAINREIKNHTRSNFYHCTEANQKEFIHLGKEHATKRNWASTERWLLQFSSVLDRRQNKEVSPDQERRSATSRIVIRWMTSLGRPFEVESKRKGISLHLLAKELDFTLYSSRSVRGEWNEKERWKQKNLYFVWNPFLSIELPSPFDRNWSAFSSWVRLSSPRASVSYLAKGVIQIGNIFSPIPYRR